MTEETFDRDELALAARVTQVLAGTQRVAYAQASPALQLVRISANFHDLVQLPPETVVVGQPLPDVLWEFVGLEPALTAVLHGQRPAYRLENVNRGDGDGQTRYLTFQALPLDARQPGLGLLLLLEDTTENGRLQQSLVQERNELRLLRRRLDAANDDLQRLNRLKSLFLSMAAHELRTPITAIFGYADLLLEAESDGMDAAQRDFLQVIRAQANRLSRIISDLLDLDQIERGALKMTLQACELGELVAEVTAVLAVEAEKRDVALHVALPPPPLLLWADPEKVRQILYNLLGNALKYTLSGGRVTLRAERAAADVTLTITDSGLGMSAAQAAELFQLYYRTEEAQQRKIQGTGLGLFIVKTLVEAHHGRIRVESTPGEGTTFTVTLPTPALRGPSS